MTAPDSCLRWPRRAATRLLSAVGWRWRHMRAEHELVECFGRGFDRLMLRKLPSEPRGDLLVRLYCAHYRIHPESCVTEAMILRHWNLEQELTAQLLKSGPKERAAVFEDCYTRLYGELGWLNTLTDKTVPSDGKAQHHRAWARWLGPPPLRVYELGAGKGELAAYLAQQGYICRAAEITTERGSKWTGDSKDGLTWGITDGIDLGRYESAGSFDVVISDHVVEHLHPQDLGRHMAGVRSLLIPGGRYIFRTPHRFSGPWDVSRVFRRPFASGMHLHEYSYRELHRSLRTAGFRRIGVPGRRHTNGSFARLLCYELVEKAIRALAFQEIRGRWMSKAGRLGLIDSQIVLVGECPK